mmetsp:Transcript_22871/g.29205  ORF Transcript_22871/g.29205 Transcript_22871/m.29205 type:complete len:83 (-) Transcript_22871:4-252(-)
MTSIGQQNSSLEIKSSKLAVLLISKNENSFTISFICEPPRLNHLRFFQLKASLVKKRSIKSYNVVIEYHQTMKGKERNTMFG